MEESTDNIESPEALHKALVEATDRVLFRQPLEEIHKDRIDVLKHLGFRVDSERSKRYFNRIESPACLIWETAHSKLVVYAVLMTEIVHNSTTETDHQALGSCSKPLENADPLTLILCDVFRNIEIHSCKLSSRYIEKDDLTRFLRVYISPIKSSGVSTVRIPDTELTAKIVTYLKFYKGGYPHPFGQTQGVVPL